MRSPTGLTALIVYFCVTTLSWARTPELKFLKSTELRDIGLKIKLMPKSTSEPLPPPRAYTYTFTRGSETWKQEMYDPRELWLRSQHAGRWSDGDGNVLTLARITRPMPRGFGSEHVTEETYDEVRARSASQPPSQWTVKHLSEWVADFTGVVGARAVRERASSLRIQDLLRFELSGAPAGCFAYAVVLRCSGTKTSSEDAPWIFIQVDVNPLIAVRKARMAIRKKLLPSLAISVFKKKPLAKHSARFQLGDGSAVGTRSTEFEESRQRVIQSIRNMREWWYVETRNYIILSNLRSKHRAMVKALQTDIEILRTAYRRFLPPRAEISAVSVLRVFATSGEYAAFVGPQYAWSGGLWLPSRKELVIRPIDWGSSRQQRERVLRVTYHEAFHQYLFYAMDMRPASVWFDEGHAAFFENTRIGNGKLYVNEDEDRLKLLQQMPGHTRRAIPSLLRMSHADFYAGTQQMRADNYALAWALIYYLRKAAPLEKPPRHAEILDLYADALWATGDGSAATSKAFEHTRMNALIADFISFWSSKQKRGKARRNRLFADYQTRAMGR